MASLNHDLTGWFSASQASRLAGMTPALLNYLCRQGVVTPSCDCHRGHGSRRHYSFGDVVALRLVAKLSASGVSFLRLRKGMERLRELHPQITLSSLPGSHIVTDGKDLYVRGEGESLERAFDGQFAFAFVVELAPIQQEVAKRMTKAQRAEQSLKKAA